MHGTRTHAPRQLVHRGVVDASAFLVDTMRGAREARIRVVRAWSPGASVFRVGDAMLVQLAAPRRVDCARAPGLPLVRLGSSSTSVIASAPLAPDEIAAAALASGSIAVVRAGAITTVIPRETDREDPATYLDMDGFDAIAVEPLGAPPSAPKIVGAQTISAPRALLGVGAAPAEQAAIVAAIAAIRAGRAPTASTDADEGVSHSAALSFFATLLGAIGGLLGRLFASRDTKPAAPSEASSSRSLAAIPAEPSGPTLADRMSARMRTLIAELLVRARLASLLGKRQAEYVRRLLEMLDRGDLTEALRHAIPLGGDAAEGPSAPMLGTPSPRTDLTISLAQTRAGAAMFAATDLYAHLRAKYRAAFERLEREGRIEEAAFVLTDLLQDAAEAVAFLERHDRLRLAAEVAEARKLAPGLVVRQWFLAGDAARAVVIARRHGAFADAIARLDKHDRAPELRILWADTLAEAGDFAAAIDVIWPVEQARKIARAWIDHAIAQGGAVAARMVVRKLVIANDAFPEVRDAVLAILAEDGPRAPIDRRTLGEALSTASALPETRVLARAAARAIAKDGAISGDRATQQLVSKLVTIADDAALRADMPAWPTIERTPLAHITAPRVVEIDAADRGTMEIHDAAYLPNGNLAVALGEAGVRVIARSGKTLFQLDQPAHQLVISDHGDRAIAIAPRDRAHRLARLDFVGRRSEPWCEAKLGTYASTFDGAQWVAEDGDKLIVIDTLDTGFTALASFDLDRFAWITSIARSETSCAVAGQTNRRCGAQQTDSDELSPMRWRYDLPAWTLRVRAPLDVSIGLVSSEYVGVAADGAIAVEASRLVHVRANNTVREVSLGDDEDCERARPIVMQSAWIACAARFSDRIEASLLDEKSLVVRMRVVLRGAGRAALRLTDDTWTIATDHGRLLVIDLAQGAVIHDLRV